MGEKYIICDRVHALSHILSPSGAKVFRFIILLSHLGELHWGGIARKSSPPSEVLFVYVWCFVGVVQWGRAGCLGCYVKLMTDPATGRFRLLSLLCPTGVWLGRLSRWVLCCRCCIRRRLRHGCLYWTCCWRRCILRLIEEASKAVDFNFDIINKPINLLSY